MKFEKLFDKNTLRQLFLYFVIGTGAVLIDSIVYTLLRVFMSFVPVALSNFFAMVSGATFGFFLNRKYTFNTTDDFYRRLVIYIFVALFGYALSTSIIMLGLWMGISEWVVKSIAIMTVAIVQFFINKYITFKQS